MGILLLISGFNRRFNGGGVWFIQNKFAFTGNLIIKIGHTAGSYGKCRLQAKYKMQTSYKMQTADRVQNAEVLQTEYKMQTSYKMQTEYKMGTSYKMQTDKKNCFFSSETW